VILEMKVDNVEVTIHKLKNPKIIIEYDPKEYQPIFIKTSEFEEMIKAVGMDKLLETPLKTRSYLQHQFLRGLPLGRLLYKVLTSEELLRGNAVLITKKD